MTCEEFDNDDDVETIVYRPRSYIECRQENEFNFENISATLDSRTLGKKNKSAKTSPRSLRRSGFTDIKNNVMNMVNTPIGRRCSKTIAQRCEERLKHALHRTSSLDNLTSDKKYNKKDAHRKSMEDNLMSGFSELAVKATAKKSTTSPTSSPGKTKSVGSPKGKTNFYTKVFTVRSKDRSQSCPTYPSIKEEGLTADAKKMIKSSSYDGSRKLKSSETDSSTNKDQACPTIKVELCKGGEHLRNNSGHWSSLSNSTGSLSSTHTVDSECVLSDNSSVFASQHSLHKRTASFGDEILIQRQYTPSPTSKKRPRSFIDIFKQENDFFKNFTKTTLKSSSSSPRLARRAETTKTEYDDIPRKLRSSTFSQNISKRASESRLQISTDNQDINGLDHTRLRAKSLNDCRDDKEEKRREHNNNIDIDVTSDVVVEDNKKISNKLHMISTPKTIKKLFKKRRNDVSQTKVPDSDLVSNEVQYENEAVSRENEINSRKCIHIESII